MKTEKMSLKSFKNALNRAEMKKIMAGSGGGCNGGGCHIDADCTGECYTCQGVQQGQAGTCSAQI